MFLFAFEIAKFYTEAFLKDLELLNIDKPEIIAKATGYDKKGRLNLSRKEILISKPQNEETK